MALLNIKKRFTKKQLQDIIELVDDLGLVPELLCTPSLLKVYHAELYDKIQQESINDVLRLESQVQMVAFLRQQNKRKKHIQVVSTVDLELF